MGLAPAYQSLFLKTGSKNYRNNPRRRSLGDSDSDIRDQNHRYNFQKASLRKSLPFAFTGGHYPVLLNPVLLIARIRPERQARLENCNIPKKQKNPEPDKPSNRGFPFFILG